jgi:hypothetical protein
LDVKTRLFVWSYERSNPQNELWRLQYDQRHFSRHERTSSNRSDAVWWVRYGGICSHFRKLRATFHNSVPIELPSGKGPMLYLHFNLQNMIEVFYMTKLSSYIPFLLAACCTGQIGVSIVLRRLIWTELTAVKLSQLAWYGQTDWASIQWRVECIGWMPRWTGMSEYDSNFVF